MNGGVGAVTEFKRIINSDNARRKVDGRIKARLIELACGPVLEGHSRWTIRLLQETRRIIKKLEIHYTPKYGRRLDIAKIGLLRNELSAWESDWNISAAKIKWQFRASDARIKLSSFYPHLPLLHKEAMVKLKINMSVH